ncbi:MAG: 23S rRNA (pseudouridine(1915)-N(3))-methyltransferase RlmH [Lachnospiraceae bacterium]|nr:23S rRNA (pseudouridine(1915)-N(3))-methyltransferase RlmH [Lachnospiraceae bacterium]
MKISIIVVGKIKEKYYRDAIKEYTKRLSRYCKLEIIEVEDEQTPDKASLTETLRIKEKEADRIMKYIREDAFVMTLEIAGQTFNSVEFAQKIEKLSVRGVSHIQFVIGGSLGLHNKVSNRANLPVSFSRMTFPHQLMRVILLEQIYRSYRIINGEPYHK